MAYNVCMISEPEDLLCPVWIVLRRVRDLGDITTGDVGCGNLC